MQVADEISKTVHLKGFRPGKVPKEVIKRQFGKVGSVEKKKVDYTKRGFINLFNRYSIKHRER